MMLNKKLLMAAVLGTCIAATTPTAFAQEAVAAETTTTPTDDDVFDMSLDELLNMQITVASKKAEKISDAPGSITAYSSNDVEKLGYYTLADLANITAGYSAFKGIGETTFETRGQMQSGFDNNKHLVLIDGIPMNHARANMAFGEENLPIFFAKRIEFLKGPGSALYGTSAFSGVINIISKDLEENGTKVETKLSLGNLDFKKRAMSNVIHKSDAGLSTFAFSYFGKDATNDYLGNGTIVNANSLNRDNSVNLFMNASHKITDGKLKGLGAGAVYSRKTGGLGEFWMFYQNQTYPINQLTWEMIVPYLKYERKLSEKVSINSYLKGNMSTEEAYTGGYQQLIAPAYGNLVGSAYSIRVLDKELLAETKYEATEKLSLIAGINVVSRHSTGAPNGYGYYWYAQENGTTYQMGEQTFFRRSSNYNIYSAYLQGQYDVNFLKGLRITAGLRYDQAIVNSAKDGEKTNSDNQISPRIALVQKITDNLNVKFMMGRALRVPLIKEVGLNEEAAEGAVKNNVSTNVIPNINSEKITTFEGAITYNTEKLSLTGTYFNNKTTDPLGRTTIPELNNTGAYTNLDGTITASGFEFEGTIAPIKNFKLGTNYSYAKALDEKNNQQANVPVSKFNTMITYNIFEPAKISVTLVNRYISGYRTGVVHGFIEKNKFAESNKIIDGFNVMDLNIMGEVTKNVGLELQVRNLLNANIKTPSGIVNSGMLGLPYPGRSFLGTLSFKF